MNQTIILVFGLLCFAISGHGQQVDQRLIDALGQQHVAGLSQDSLDYYQYFIDNGYVIEDNMPLDKRQLLPSLTTLTLKDGTTPFQSLVDLTNFNRLLVAEPVNKRASQSFQIPNSTKVLVLPSRFQLKLMASNE